MHRRSKHAPSESQTKPLKKRGVRLPLVYEGFGETTPAVKTADNVDEPRNRRVDYIISDGPPRFSTTFRASWKRAP